MIVAAPAPPVPRRRSARLLASADRLGTSLFGDADRVDLVRLLTLVFFAIHSSGRIEFPAETLAILGILVPAARRHWGLWAALTVLHLVGQIPLDWAEMPNHEWLAIWWLVSLTGASVAPDPAAALRRAARVTLGLVFLFAALWKIMTPEFVSGDFFEVTIVTDDRMDVVARLAGADAGVADRNWDQLDRFVEVGGPAEVTLESGSRIALVSDALTWATIVMEGALALVFLVRHPTAARWRDPLLLGFVVLTYPIAPVVSFAWLLLTMGLAQTTWRRPNAELVFVGFFVALHLIDQGSVAWSVIEKVL